MSRTYSRCREHYDLKAVRHGDGERAYWRATIWVGPRFRRTYLAAQANDPSRVAAICAAYDAYIDAMRRGEVGQ